MCELKSTTSHLSSTTTKRINNQLYRAIGRVWVIYRNVVIEAIVFKAELYLVFLRNVLPNLQRHFYKIYNFCFHESLSNRGLRLH